VLIVASVTATNNYTKEGQFRSLNKISDDKQIKVMRDSEEMIISIYDVNVGDVVILETGDKIAADGVYISGYGIHFTQINAHLSSDLKIDESVITGETDAVKKNEHSPWILSGSQVAEGVGRMLIIGVGVNSEWGRTLLHLIGKTTATEKKEGEEKDEKEEVKEESDQTPLQELLEEMAKNIGKIGLGVATVVFIVLIIYWAVHLGSQFSKKLD
jgi:Ca2+-transporting ATPase